MNLIQRAYNHYSEQVIKQRYKNDDPIVIAGLGRCGTTLLTRSLFRTRRGNYYFITDLHNIDFQRGTVYKTHDYPNFKALKTYPKVIFMFGDPLDTAVSATSKINYWGYEHYQHLHSDKFVLNENLIYEDGLCLEKLFNAWYRPQKFSFLSIRYESLYEQKSIDLLNDYLGYKIKLIPYRKRESQWSNHPKKDILLKTYERLLDKINNAEDCKVWDMLS